VKIYTKTGDGGETALFGGGRVAKDHPRVEAYGSVDELNAVLGWAVTKVATSEIRDRLRVVQHDLFALGAELATPPGEEGRRRPETPPLPVARIGEMESWIDASTEEVGPLKNFILPGGAEGAAALHLGRTVCRRVERAVAPLVREGEAEPEVLRYLNRLSDALFALARLENHRAGVDDVVWRKDGAGA
jgi:cob(I)alamin adenosyltransferase